MLRRVNGALFEAPLGARIQVVAEAQSNNGVNDARFEYAGQILPRQTILGLPGCSFTVAASSERLEAGVVFDPGAPGAARYDLFEVENGVKSNLKKFVRSSDGSILISFAIDPVFVTAAFKTVAKKKRPGRKKTATKAAKKTAKKTTRGAKKPAARRRTAAKRKASRKSPR
jgi:hypothetical protein